MKVIGAHVTKFFCVDKLVWSIKRGKVQNLSLNSYQNESHSHTNPRPTGLLLCLDEIIIIVIIAKTQPHTNR